MVLDGSEVVHPETLIKGLGRMRDIATTSDGLVYLLLEHAEGSRILGLVPVAGQ